MNADLLRNLTAEQFTTIYANLPLNEQLAVDRRFQEIAADRKPAPKKIARVAWLKAFKADGWWKGSTSEAKAVSLVLNACLDYREGRLSQRSTQWIVNHAFDFSWSSALCELNRQIERYPELSVFKN